MFVSQPFGLGAILHSIVSRRIANRMENTLLLSCSSKNGMLTACGGKKKQEAIFGVLLLQWRSPAQVQLEEPIVKVCALECKHPEASLKVRPQEVLSCSCQPAFCGILLCLCPLTFPPKCFYPAAIESSELYVLLESGARTCELFAKSELGVTVVVALAVAVVVAVVVVVVLSCLLPLRS